MSELELPLAAPKPRHRNRGAYATPNLRFVLRDGKRILQQGFIVSADPFDVEWRDIPLVEEET